MSNRYDGWFKLRVAQHCLHDDTSLTSVPLPVYGSWRNILTQHGNRDSDALRGLLKVWAKECRDYEP